MLRAVENEMKETKNNDKENVEKEKSKKNKKRNLEKQHDSNHEYIQRALKEKRIIYPWEAGEMIASLKDDNVGNAKAKVLHSLVQSGVYFSGDSRCRKFYTWMKSYEECKLTFKKELFSSWEQELWPNSKRRFYQGEIDAMNDEFVRKSSRSEVLDVEFAVDWLEKRRRAKCRACNAYARGQGKHVVSKDEANELIKHNTVDPKPGVRSVWIYQSYHSLTSLTRIAGTRNNFLHRTR